MSPIEEITIVVQGVSTYIARAGSSGADDVVFLHGGIPGVTPYCGGVHLWRGTLQRFTADARVTAFDLLASGRTGYHPSDAPIILDQMGEHALATIEELGIDQCHLVGHDLGGLLALWLTVKAPNRISSVSVVASMAAAPTGDWLNDLVFSDPPEPLWTEASQRWALDRISHQLHHIDDQLIAACVEAAGLDGPVRAQKHMADAVARAAFVASMNRAKARLWALSRDDRFPRPLQVIWGAQDPLTTHNHGLTLFQTLAQHQPEAQFHLIDRSGSFVFREQPEPLRRVVEAFRRGLAETGPEFRYG